MMSGTSSYFTGSSYLIPPHRKNSHYSRIICSVPSHSKFQNIIFAGDLRRRLGMFTMKCEPWISKITAKPDLGTASLSPSPLKLSSPSVDDEDDRSNSAFTFILFDIDSIINPPSFNDPNEAWIKIQKLFGSKLCITSLVVMALSASNDVQPALSFTATGMVHAETEIAQESSPSALSLARHLQSIGAKLYGAFWCSHCVHQKQMFGHEAAKLLNYVECFPDGIEEGAKMAEACSRVQLKAFPTWEINGQVYTGEKKLPELARLSGIEIE